MLPPEAFGPQPSTGAIEVVTTPDGFDNFDLGVDFAEPHMSSSPMNVLWFFNAFNINATHHTLNGHDWSVNNPAFPSQAGDPVTAYDSLGNLYYMNMKNPINGAWVVRSTNGGQTWGSAVTAVNGVDKCWIAADQSAGPYSNYVYAVMTNGSGRGDFTRSTNFGASWDTTFRPRTQQLPGMMVAVGPNVLGGNVSGGCVYVVTNSGTTSNSKYSFYRSTNGGATFDSMSAMNAAGYVGTLNTAGRLVINNARTRPYPFIAADNSFGPHRGRLYLVYASNDPAGNGNKPDIFLQHSTNQGLTWSARVRVNDNPNPTATNEWFPAIWCDKKTGRLYIKWYDMRNDPANQRAWVYGTYSDDGGITFAPNQKISNADFVYPSPACTPNTNCYRGDYDAITSNEHVSMAVWADFRNGNYGSFVGYFPDFAMLVSPVMDTIYSTDSADVLVMVPAVKAYTNTAKFSATVSPPAGFVLSFPQGDSLTTYPDTLTMRMRTSGAAAGMYTVTVTGKGPNGTPVHRRSISIVVQTLPTAINMIVPGGGEMWEIGGVQALQWSSSNLTGNVKIDLSRNGGASFTETLFANTANDGTESWTVSGPATSAARVRIASITQPSIADTSNGIFTIAPPFFFLSQLTLRDNGNESHTLEFGTAPGATDGIDAVYGEFELPPRPPIGVFDVRWSITGKQGSERDIRDTIDQHASLSSSQVTYTGLLQAGAGGYPFTLRWDTGELPSGMFQLKSGESFFNMKQQDSLVITNEDVSSFQIIYSQSITVSVSVLGGWNVMSVPVTLTDLRKTEVFPTSNSNAFAYTASGYTVRDTLRYGEGFWLKFPSSQSIDLTGGTRTVDTIDVVQGWNMIGSISEEVPSDSITQIPPGIVQSSYFAYQPGAGYGVADTVKPMAGYWVKVSQNGTLVLRNSVDSLPLSGSAGRPGAHAGPSLRKRGVR